MTLHTRLTGLSSCEHAMQFSTSVRCLWTLSASALWSITSTRSVCLAVSTSLYSCTTFPSSSLPGCCEAPPAVPNVSIVPTIWMVHILSRLPWVIPSHAHLPPVQLVPDVAQKTNVRLQNLAACAKATSSLKVVMTSCPSESGGGLPALHSIVLLLADESKVFSFQIQHLDDLTFDFLFYSAFGSKIIGQAVTSL